MTHNQHMVGNNLDFLWDSRVFGMDNRLAAQLQVSRNWITFLEEGDPNDYPYDNVAVVDPVREFTAREFPDIRNKRLTISPRSFEDRLKLTSAFALIGGIRVDDWTLIGQRLQLRWLDSRKASRSPRVWTPVSYRAAITYEPIHDLMFYGMYATAYDPAAADVFSVNTTVPLELTSAQIYETGAKQMFWDNRAEWTFAAYDIASAMSMCKSVTRRTLSPAKSPPKALKCRRGASAPRLEALGQCRL